MIYVRTEWNGKGSGDKTTYTDKGKAMSDRECTLTQTQVVKKHGRNYFMATDIKCTTIDSYTSSKAVNEGRVKTTATWY